MPSCRSSAPPRVSGTGLWLSRALSESSEPTVRMYSSMCACTVLSSAILEAGLGSGDLAPLPALSLPYGWGVPPHWACVACPPATISSQLPLWKRVHSQFHLTLLCRLACRLSAQQTPFWVALRALFCSFQMCSLVSFPGPTLAPLAV